MEAACRWAAFDASAGAVSLPVGDAGERRLHSRDLQLLRTGGEIHQACTLQRGLAKSRRLSTWHFDCLLPGMIRKLKSGEYRLYSRKKDPHTHKRKNLGTFSTREAAQKHERAVQYFKRAG